MIEKLCWDIRIPIFKNRLVLKQLGMAVGIPFGLLVGVLLLTQAYYGLLLVAAVLILTVLFILVCFRGTYDVRYHLDSKGVLCENQPRQMKRIKKLSAFTFLLGIATRTPTAAGAALLSGSSTQVRISWKQVRKVKFLDRQHCILVNGGFGENIALFCTDENYELVKALLQSKTTH